MVYNLRGLQRQFEGIERDHAKDSRQQRRHRNTQSQTFLQWRSQDRLYLHWTSGQAVEEHGRRKARIDILAGLNELFGFGLWDDETLGSGDGVHFTHQRPAHLQRVLL